MTKIFKVLGFTLITIFILVAISIGLLVTFVSPNKFKPIISAQAMKYTGRKLTIDGNLSWSFFPYLSLRAGHMVLQNPAGFENKIFAEIADAKVGVKFMPLFHGKVETSGIAISGLKLNLIKSPLGTSNWIFVPAAPIVAAAQLQTQAHDKYSIDMDKNTNSKKMIVDVVIPSIDVNDANITWSDLQTKQTATIRNFEFHATNLNMNSPFSVKSSFDFTANQPDVSGKVTFAAKVQFNPNQEFFTVKNINLTSQINQPKNKFDVQISGDLIDNLRERTINFSQLKTSITNLKEIKGSVDVSGNAIANLADDTLTISDLDASAANLHIKGSANVTNLSGNPQIKGHFVAAPFDLKTFLKNIGQDNANLQTAKMLSANVDFTAIPTQGTASTQNPFAALQGVSLQANVKLDELRAAKIKASALTIDANLQNGVLNLSSVNASLYDGFLKSQAKIVLTSANPQIIFSGKLANIQAGPLLKDVGDQNNTIKLQGTANVDLQLTTLGMDQKTLIHNLNGTSHFSIVNGKLDGVNIGNMIDKAYATLKGQPQPADAENSTNFGVLTGNAVINNGVLTNNDLYIDSPRFDTKGKGVLDLVNQRIDYLLETNLKDVAANHQDSSALNLYNIAIPIRISGDLTNPSTRLDIGTLAQAIAKMQMQRVQTQAQDKIKNEIGNKIQLKGKLGDQANKLINNFLGN